MTVDEGGKPNLEMCGGFVAQTKLVTGGAGRAGELSASGAKSSELSNEHSQRKLWANLESRRSLDL